MTKNNSISETGVWPGTHAPKPSTVTTSFMEQELLYELNEWENTGIQAQDLSDMFGCEDPILSNKNQELMDAIFELRITHEEWCVSADFKLEKNAKKIKRDTMKKILDTLAKFEAGLMPPKLQAIATALKKRYEEEVGK
jgi:hypothetical protein